MVEARRSAGALTPLTNKWAKGHSAKRRREGGGGRREAAFEWRALVWR